jgi:hypothetical protein
LDASRFLLSSNVAAVTVARFRFASRESGKPSPETSAFGGTLSQLLRAFVFLDPAGLRVLIIANSGTVVGVDVRPANPTW